MVARRSPEVNLVYSVMPDPLRVTHATWVP